MLNSGEVWRFDTKRFSIVLEVERDWDYEYDGDDPEGETQAKLDCGEYIAFDSRVVVYLDLVEEIASDSLCGSVYSRDDYADFWTAHRDRDPMNRNCSVMRAANGNCSICHYFPDMVRRAVGEARSFVANFPKLRAYPE